MNIRPYSVRPSLPKRLSPLMDIANNQYWTWIPEAVQLFQRIDLDLWESSYHNPTLMLGRLNQDRFAELLGDESFLAHMDNVAIELEDYLHSTTWYSQHADSKPNMRVCYFSAEFGLHESLPIYSGGLGLLAGDHLKSASDLGLPLTAIGLLYRQGYFRQYLNAEGWQQETFPELDFTNMPLTLLKDEEGRPLSFRIPVLDRQVTAQIWLLQVGRIELYLLDTNTEENQEEDRRITDQLYGGDLEMRIKQEILLGVGGMRALKTLGIVPTVCHMNEGHSAFLALERIRTIIEQHGMSFAEAAELVSASNVFTTHTPVPAGNDIFPADLVERYFHSYYSELGLAREQFLGLGRQDPFDHQEPFCMTVLAMRLAASRNGVSELHGSVSRNMWKRIWPGLPNEEIPIDHITNGVHTAGWASNEHAQLYSRYLGPRWRLLSQDERAWAGVDRIPDAELWRTHERRRERLVAFARKRVVQHLSNRGALQSDIRRASEILDPEALTIGFARRFATYKRGAMLLSDSARLEKILNDPDRPVQILFAGKAHPRDQLGKEVIKRIVQAAREPRFRNRLVFLEDYDINVAHYLVQGVDVWINNPRRPLEASGTSGMKVSVNGGLNVSVLDGWWVEAYAGDNGWAIGAGEEYADHDYQDQVESRALYDLLEKEVVPMFYNRGRDGLPRDWIAHMKGAIRSIAPNFSTHRMVSDYFEKFYVAASRSLDRFSADNFKAARELAEWKNSIRRRWMHIEIQSVEAGAPGDMAVGGTLPIEASLRLGEIMPTEVSVEAYYGRLDSTGQIRDGRTLPLKIHKTEGDGRYLFAGQIPLDYAGRCGYAVRVLPVHPLMVQRFEPGLVLWG